MPLYYIVDIPMMIMLQTSCQLVGFKKCNSNSSRMRNTVDWMIGMDIRPFRQAAASKGVDKYL